jgi:predicted RNA-binding Zn-ribbon protein involved in translation (DUF1610 family)
MSMPVFWYVYQVCAVVFFVQGLAIPFLLLASGMLWRRQNRRLEALRGQKKRSLKPNARKEEQLERILGSLPKLRPLNCVNCGGAVLLRDTEAVCPSCGARTDLPEDYAATASLRHQVGKVLKSALAHRRVARILTHRVTGLVLGLLALFEFLLFPLVLIGAATYSESWIDPALAGIEDIGGSLVVGVFAFLGWFLWMFIFPMLSAVSKESRGQVPAAPVLASETREREASNCQSCGGGIEYDSGDFACICNYCNVVNYRAQFARVELTKAQAERTKTSSALFGAMEIIDDMNGTFLFVMAILVVGCVLVVIGQAFAND